MELRGRAERLIRPQTLTAIPPVTASVGNLANMERLHASRRWLRGVMCFLAVFCYGLALFDKGRVITHFIMLVFSLAAEVAIASIYRGKAKFHGLTNRAHGKKGVVSVFHSPSLCLMLLEMLVWVLQCPPLPDDVSTEWLVGLDGFLPLRFYVFLLYGTNVAHNSAFAHAIASLARIRLNHRFFVRTASLLEHLRVTLSVVAVGVCVFAYAYAKAETVSFGEALYFCVSTASLAGYSESSPVTLPGRVLAVCVTLLGVTILCWAVGVMNQALALTQAERNLHALFRSNELCGQVPAQAARLIQRAWNLYRARRDRRNFISRQISAFLLSQQAITYREMRRELMRQETAFLHSISTVEGSLAPDISFESSLTTPFTSRTTTPETTPRSRRPFPLFQEMCLKRDSRTPTPRGREYLQAGNEELPGHRRGPTRLTLASMPSPMMQPLKPPHATPVVPSLAELELRLSKLEMSLEALATTAEALQGRYGVIASVSV
ncbi:ion transport protein [Trypanosoma rangeli]|uniref:Ion transport protein n=1 Tax=Trypanosoma rangeli TaxID=5698 RepID=A0A422NNJ1_TRYRA|nr:ion transport protein [Trypanosoma rangeli]RNF07080.1 ion transport protein [Trypanosoma rangeli]|eukprot:RNF07080.1 ion transport protein [Trypanosoma rangeli]